MTEQQFILKYEKIKEKYPKATEKLQEWVRNGLENLQKILQKESRGMYEAPEITKEMVEKAAASVFSVNWRSLFDFFDMYQIHISIQWNGANNWVYDIGEGYSSEEESRQMAEFTAIERAFEELNNKL